MCGICGIVEADMDRADAAGVEAMTRALVHRGPDSGGVWSRGEAALGARRLRIVDLSSGEQPMVSADGRYVLVFNGEIYNAAELRRELTARGATFSSHCDTEVVLEAFAQFGVEALHRLNGMFGFAVWDTQERRLTLARDRLGIKPVYFSALPGAIVFASELDALMRSGRIKRSIRGDALRDYFSYGAIPWPRTIYEGVEQLGPGELLVWERGSARKEVYWKPEVRAAGTWTLDSAAERFRELLDDSVRMQRVSDVPLGAFLSGGLDSSAVVQALCAAGDDVETFTIGFAAAEADEREYAQAVADHLGTRHYARNVDANWLDVLPKLVRHFGEPFADSSAIPTYAVSQWARERVTVSLSGDGGDELFAGYTWLHRTLDAMRLARLPGGVRRSMRPAIDALLRGPRAGQARRFVSDSFLPPVDAFRRRHLSLPDEAVDELLRPSHGSARTWGDRFLEHAEEAASGDPVEVMQQIDLRMYLPDDILTKVDRMSMAVSLEARVPLLDHRIVEFAASLPFELKHRRGQSKRVPKHALRDRLPASTLRQRKRGFAIPLHAWFRGPWSGAFRDSVLSPESPTRDWIDIRAAARLFEAHATGRENYGHALWGLMVFDAWLRYQRGLPG